MQDTAGSLAARMRHSGGMRRYWGTMKRLMEECDELMLAQEAEMVFTSHQDVAEAVHAALLHLEPPTSANSAGIATTMQPVLADEVAATFKVAAASLEQLQQPLQQPVQQAAEVSTAAPKQSLQPALAEATARTDATADAAAAGDDAMAVVAPANSSAATAVAAAAAAAAVSDDAMAVAEPPSASATATATAAAAGAAANDKEPDAAPTTRGSKKRRRVADDSTAANVTAPTAVVQYGQDPKLFLKGVCIYIVNRGSISSKMIEVSAPVL
jgi:hypothetical protein